MKRHAKRLFGLVALVPIGLMIPLYAGHGRIEVQEVCAGSCAPKSGWFCVYDTIWKYNFCDPDSKGCLDDPE